MYTCYSTHLLPQVERQPYWQGAIENTYFPLELDIRDPQRFHGHLSQWQLGRLGVSRLESSATCFKRVTRHLSDSEEPYFLITIPADGRVHFSQANRNLICNPGAFILERSDLPYEFHYNTDNTLWVMRVPVSVLRFHIREPERYLYMEFDKQKGMGAVFCGFLKSVVQQSAYLDDSSQSVMNNQLLELLALSLQSDDRVLMSNEAGIRSVHLRNIEHYVREHLQRSDLAPDQIAAACNISTRYLHKLFKDSEQTVSQWIKELRLQSALNDIKANTGDTTLAEIAYRWGFNDQAHFCRLFKSRFNCTPREMRESR